MGKLLAICTSPKRGTVKTEVPSAVLTPEWGIISDAHGGSWHRQVSLLSAEKIEAFRKKIWVDYGAFGENLVIEGFDFRNLPVTSRFAIGSVVLEMTQIGKECHNDCVIKQQTGECIMPREGVFARVLEGGEIHVGDEVTLLPPAADPPLRAAVITLSDKGSRGEREDKSGPLIVEMLTAAGYVVEETMILPDEAKALKAQLIRLADGRQVNLILTTGGTGFSPRDITPEATYAVADRNAPGIAEAMRAHSLAITPYAMLSRALCMQRGRHLVINLPGSETLSTEQLDSMIETLNTTYPDNQFVQQEVSNVNPTIGNEFLDKSVVAVVAACVLILLYVAVRFRRIGGWSAGAMAIVALLHDMFVVYGVFVLLRIPLNGNFIAAMLTILGYSINDTVVIYDRIRENTGLYGKKMSLPELVNLSINQSFGRSMMTSITTCIALAIVCVVSIIFKLDSIFTFAVPLLFGMVSGVYSTMCIATQLWVSYKTRKAAPAPKKA